MHKEWFPCLCAFFRYFGIEPAGAEETASWLRAGLARVKPENRQALIFYYLEAQSLEEVAARGETSVPTAWRRVRRGRRELCDALTHGRQPAPEAAYGRP